MSAARKGQIVNRRPVRRTGLVRYVLWRGLGAGCIAGLITAGVSWLKYRHLGLGAEVVMAFVIFGGVAALRASRRWKALDSNYPGIIDRQ